MLSPYIWLAIILTLLVIVIVVKLVRKPKSQATAQPQSKAAMQSGRVELSVVERCCLQSLQQVAGAEYHIHSKIELAGICNPGMKKQNRSKQLLDFVLYSKSDNKPACVIQLQAPPAERDDDVMQLVLKQMGIPLYSLARSSSYPIEEMQALLQTHLENPAPSPDEMVETISMRAFRQCRKCSSPMALKRASGGAHKGMLFWVCENYPECSGVELYNDE